MIYPDLKKLAYTIKVVTLWYRAPELLIGVKNYTEMVDIWSLGCFFAELFIGKTLFPGNKEMQQMALIWDVCGTPEPTKFDHWKYVKPVIRDDLLKHKKPRRLREFLKEKNVSG